LSEPWTKVFVKIYERIAKLDLLFIDISLDESSNLTTGTDKYTYRMPYAFSLSEIRASVSSAPTGDSIIVDINKDASSILSTKLHIDDGEKSSQGSSTSVVISDSELEKDSELTFDIDQIGSGNAGKGLKIYLLGYRI
jgi:hypothetical protein